MQLLTVILLMTGLFAFFTIGMILNSKIPQPEGVTSMSCGNCPTGSCPSNPKRLESLKQEIKDSIKNDSERV